MQSESPYEIIYTPQRDRQHIEIVCKLLVSLRNYQGRSTAIYEDFVEAFREIH
jgi:hypothetical protein